MNMERRAAMRVFLVVSGILLLLLVLVSSSASADCTDYAQYLRWRGYVFALGSVGNGCGVAVTDAHAYLADGREGLKVIDVSDPERPQIVGAVDTPAFAWGVAVAGSYAYVCDDTLGLQVVDVADPQAPFIV